MRKTRVSEITTQITLLTLQNSMILKSRVREILAFEILVMQGVRVFFKERVTKYFCKPGVWFRITIFLDSFVLQIPYCLVSILLFLSIDAKRRGKLTSSERAHFLCALAQRCVLDQILSDGNLKFRFFCTGNTLLILVEDVKLIITPILTRQ